MVGAEFLGSLEPLIGEGRYDYYVSVSLGFLKVEFVME
jgi:hypothetical protein